MNNMKKFASLLLALVMVLAMAVPAMAAKITVNDGDVTGAEYAAYKLLNSTSASAGAEGDAGDLFAYTLNEKYEAILKEVTGKTTQEDIVAYINALDATGIQTFANNVYAKILAADPAIAADYTTNDNVFDDVAQGYYLIAETKAGAQGDTFSLVMLDTSGQNDVTVNTKEEKPTVEKKVEEKNDSTGETSTGTEADYDVGDEIKFTLTGTVDGKIDTYTTYYYAFHDTMEHMTYKGESVVVTIDGKTVKSGYTVAWDATNKKLDVTFTDLKNCTDTDDNKIAITADTKVVVTYIATLDSDAVIGSTGNKNKVTLEYSNNPYGNDKGTTPEEIVTVYTYELIVDKTDGENALAGAGFTLYKWIPNDSEEKGSWVAVGNEIKVTELVEGKATFNWERLDAGKYKLVETTVPAGYNKAADVEFTITADHEKNELTTENTSVNGNYNNGTVSTTVINNSGTELPETGGMGTTVIYVAGGLLVAAAVIMMVSKRRRAA